MNGVALFSLVKPQSTGKLVRHKNLKAAYHEIPLAINGFLTRYLSMESSIKRLEMQMRQPSKELRCTMICRKTSLVLSAWFRKRRQVAGQIVGPDLNRFFEDVEMDNNWEQVIPQSVLAQLGLQQQTLPSGDGFNRVGGGASSGGAPRGGAPSGGAPGGAGGGAATEGRQPGTRINNVNFVASMFQRFREMTAVTFRCSRREFAVVCRHRFPCQKSMPLSQCALLGIPVENATPSVHARMITCSTRILS